MNVLKSTSASLVKYFREHDFDVILGSVVPCRKLRWMCRKHSNDVAQQVEMPGKSTILSSDKLILSRDISFMSRQRLHYTVTVRHLDTAKDACSV